MEGALSRLFMVSFVPSGAIWKRKMDPKLALNPLHASDKKKLTKFF